MEFYISIMLLTLIISVLFPSKKYSRLVNLFVYLAILWSSFSLSSTNGLIDLSHYAALYSADVKSFYELVIFSTGVIGSNEPLFLLSIYLSKFLGINFELFRFIYCATSLIVLFKVFLKIDKNGLMMFALFMSLPVIIFLYTNVIRQGLALALFILFVSSVNVKSTSNVRRCFFGLLTILTHYASFLPILIVCLIGLVTRCNFLKIRVSVSRVFIFVSLLSLMISTSFFINISTIVYKISYYLSQEINFSNIISFSYLSSIFILVAFTYSRKRYFALNEDSMHIYYIAMLVLCTFAIPFNDIYNRLVIYKTPLEIVIVVRVLSCFTYQGINLFRFVLIFSFIYLSMNLVLSPAYKVFN